MAANVTQIEGGTKINVDVSAKIRKNTMCAKNVTIGDLAPYSCKNGKYVGSITDNSLITCGEVIEKTNTSKKI